MDSFIEEHASTDQAYLIVSFITEHISKVERPREKKRNYKSLLMAKGNLLGALLNQTIMKLISAAKSIKDLDGVDTKTWF